MKNANLTRAKSTKNDEFYTQWADIEKEVQAYLEYNPDVFRGKTVLCPCDDPYESNFFKYFALSFNVLGLKKLIATCYAGSPIANTQLSLFDYEEEDDKTTKAPHKIIVNEGIDENNDGVFNLDDIIESLAKNKKNTITKLDGNGDFRSEEVISLRNEADIIITNPPFSLFREFLVWILEADKDFLIIGNMNAITYKEVFPLIKDNKLWLGNGFNAGNAYFATPSADSYGEGVYNPDTGLVKFRNCCWFTNLDHGRRHQPLPLLSMADNLKFSRHKEIRGKAYAQYDNYKAIEVPYTDAIPDDYNEVMGVPISFLHKYCPEQFEIIGASDNGAIDDIYKLPHFKTHNEPYVQGKKQYKRIFIKRK